MGLSATTFGVVVEDNTASGRTYSLGLSAATLGVIVVAILQGAGHLLVTQLLLLE